MTFIFSLLIGYVIGLVFIGYLRRRITGLQKDLLRASQQAKDAESQIKVMADTAKKLSALEQQQRDELVNVSKPENISNRNGFSGDWMPGKTSTDL